MLKSFRIGRLFGFPIDVNLSFLLLLGFVLLFMGGLTGVAVVVLAFASVLLHELGHALVARHLGVPIAGIELYFFGGAAKMVGQPRSAGDEIAIAAAGPAVSFALAGIGLGLGALTGVGLLQLLGTINLVVALFNLIPALPMDGGRILRALLARRMSFLRATEISITVSRVAAVAFAVLGVLWMHFMLIAIAVLVWFMGNAELRMARVRGYSEWNRGGVEVHPGGYVPGPRLDPRAPPPRTGTYYDPVTGIRIIIHRL